MAFDNTNLLENATQANNGDFVFTNRGGTVDSGVQTANSAGEWSEENGGTVSTGTGPSANPAGRSGFIYTETSSPAASTVWAMRRSASFDSTTQNVFLDLIYNLNADTGSSVFIEYATIASPNETTDWTTLETIACTATDSWISDTFDFSAISTSTLWLRVRLETTNAFTNDVAFSTWREYSVDTGGGGGGGTPTGTIHVGEWRGGTVSGIVPDTTFAAVPGALTFQVRNDNSSYSMDLATSTLTLPSTDLADGYLLIAAFEYEDTSNGRAMLNGRVLQTSGTGNAIAPITGGYCRDTSENIIYVRTWAFVHNPSASSTFQFQWRRDVDPPTGGTLRCNFEVISFFYDGVSMYESNSTALYGGTTPNQIQNITTVFESSGATRTGNAITLNNNKNYLCLGAGHVLGTGNARSQRWLGFRENSTKLDHSKGYYYIRNNNNSCTGAMFSNIIQSTGSTTMDMFSYTGDGVANGDGGADLDGSAPTSAEYYMAFIELNDQTACIQTTNGSQTTDINQPVITDVPSFDTTLLDVSKTYFTNIGANSGVTIEAAKDFTLLAGSNMSCAANNVSQTARFTGFATFFKDTTLQAETYHGNYLRNNQGSADTFGWSANQLSATEMVTSETFKNTARRLAGSEGGGAPTIQVGWHGTWGLAIESMVDAPPASGRRIFNIT